MKPQIEEIIAQNLNADKQKIASDLAGWLRKNKMTPSPEWIGATYNAFVAKCNKGIICRIEIAQDGSWKIKLYLSKIRKYETLIIIEGIQQFIWQHLKYCPDEKCGTKCNDIGTLTILGKEFSRLCKDTNVNYFLSFTIENPDEKMLVKIYRLLELEQKTRKGVLV